jgi:hypothetical protein
MLTSLKPELIFQQPIEGAIVLTGKGTIDCTVLFDYFFQGSEMSHLGLARSLVRISISSNAEMTYCSYT